MIFETEKDRRNQDRLEMFLETKGYSVKQTETTDPIDMEIYHKGKLHALVEFKQRDKLWNPLKVDHSKISSLVTAARERGVKGIFIVGVGSRYYFTEAHVCWPEGSLLRKRGGQRRGETTDRVFEIPARDFVTLA